MRDRVSAVMLGGGRGGAVRPALALGALALLSGACSGFNDGSYRVASALADTGGRIGMPWGTMRPAMPEQATTVERVALGVPPGSTLLPEAGDVWPGPLPPRATLANPDAALSGIPAYAPATGRRDDTSDMAPPPPRPVAGPPRGLPRGSSSPPPPAMVTIPPDPRERIGLVPAPPTPPGIPAVPPRADGQVIHTPNGPVVTSGGTDRIQSFNVPGGGTGTAIRDGNTTTLIGPGSRIQTIPTAPR